MPIEIVMPKLGLTMTEGQILEWKIKEGEPVKKGDVLFVLETEKVTYEVEAPDDGLLAKIISQENATVPVGQIVCYLGREGEDFSDLDMVLPPAGQGETIVQEEQAIPAVQDQVSQTGVRVKTSPLAKKLARAYNIDLSAVQGTGPGGRILRADVEAANDQQKTVAVTPQMDTVSTAEDRLVPFTGMRRAIASKMLASKIETAQTYMSITVDATKIVEYRKKILPIVEKKHGIRVTITDVMMKITAVAIKEHPVINTRWTDKGILYLGDVHMGMAMALGEGLIVPVIRHINSKGFAQIALDRNELIRKGKEKQFLPDDISGSTFTLSAMGMFGIEQFTSNINLPENAILAVGAIIDKPVVYKGDIVIRPMMTVTLSYDHRAIDGAEAGKFMQTLKLCLEDPIQIFV
jgi:pyruvate dehydrogenase E2 component (dihydrolipoamide acetyltransferase)